MQNDLEQLARKLFGTEPEIAIASAHLVGIGEAAVEPLIAALLSEQHMTRAAAQRCLLFIGDPAVPRLIEACHSPSLWLRQRAAETLGRCRDARAVETLTELLGDKVSDVRMSSAQALGQIGDARAAQPLISLLADHSAMVCAAAATALGNINSEEVIGPLINALSAIRISVRDAAALALIHLDHPNTTRSLLALIGSRRSPKVRARGVWVLGHRRDFESILPIIAALSDSESGVRAAAAYAIGGMKGREFEEALIVALKDNAASVRVAAATSLGLMRSSAAVEPLIALLADPDQDVLDAAATALKLIDDPRMAHAMLNLLRTARGVALEQAIYALAFLEDERALPLLIEISRRDWSSVEAERKARDAAQQVLRLLQNSSSGVDSPSVRLQAVTNEELADADIDTSYALSGSALSHRTEVFVTRPREEVVARAIRDLQAEDNTSRAVAADSLGKLGGPAALEALLTALKTAPLPDYHNISHIARALGVIGDAHAVDPLLTLLQQGNLAESEWQSDSVIGSIVVALGSIGDGRAVEPLIPLTRNPRSHVRGTALSALQEIGDARAEPAFIESLQTDGNKIRRIQAAEGLARFADLVAAEPLRIALYDPEPRVRAAAANALGSLGDAGAAPILKRMVEVEEDRAARKAAEEALVEIKTRRGPQGQKTDGGVIARTALSNP